ncbi:Fe-S cluster assembly protein HesB [Acidiferrimicrobium sp. IK]|uniref:HhH-GPD-type base excision DNA repair protein n=1 Tax=Acidiferrimicrobium sp. IK TaxID=2871700 RepID=UPI0021CB2116|nr:HhH-GPD-type base excision DNA repair protein [Acidiferrimicrobium sp. IK]MCU4184268.1 Fe-S cluster assembly protein HesB [Acidiferrimicrobium sp. IK]
MPAVTLRLSGDPDADALLSEDPLALLIGMVLDQQIPLEKAFSSPRDLKDRLGGTLDAAAIADMDPDALTAVFCERPALHRFPAANAKRVQELCRIVAADYGGDAANVWATASSGDELYARIKALPGFGEQKARIFVGLLGKQLGVRPPGWQGAAGKFGQPGTYLSVADITSAESLGRVRAYKQQTKAAAKAAAAGASAPSAARR